MPFAELTATLPRDIAHIALDERSNEYVAYKRDGSLYGRYLADAPGADFQRRTSGATCGNLTVAEAQSLPGWNTLSKYADDNWGTGSRKVVTNPSDVSPVIDFDAEDIVLICCLLLQISGSPAEVCVTSQIVQATFDGMWFFCLDVFSRIQTMVFF